MTYDEQDELKYKKMVADGVRAPVAWRCVRSDRNPSWNIKFSTNYLEPKVKPWRCPECGQKLNVHACLQCYIDGKGQISWDSPM
jgi:hypothetical protein